MPQNKDQGYLQEHKNIQHATGKICNSCHPIKKITRYAKEWKEKNQCIETDSEMTGMIELADKEIMSILHMCMKLDERLCTLKRHERYFLKKL